MYTRLLGRRYAFSGVMISKTTATMMMPTRTGRTPLSPLRMRCSQAREILAQGLAARSSGGTSASAAPALGRGQVDGGLMGVGSAVAATLRSFSLPAMAQTPPPASCRRVGRVLSRPPVVMYSMTL